MRATIVMAMLSIAAPALAQAQEPNPEKRPDSVQRVRTTAPTGQAARQRPPRSGARTGADRMLRAVDTNQDGSISYEELKARRPNLTKKTFDRLDTNGDGVITRTDRANRTRPAGTDGRPEALQRLMSADANQDGSLTYEELTASKPGYPRENFDRRDTNKDGVISPEDAARRTPRQIPGQPRTAGRRAPEQRMQRLRQADTNNDGSVSLDELRSRNPNFTQQQFQHMDQNGDGKIDQHDFANRQRSRLPN